MRIGQAAALARTAALVYSGVSRHGTSGTAGRNGGWTDLDCENGAAGQFAKSAPPP
jgi:hypothetical protein